ncbi:glycosyltransferase [Acinetobacter indicus]|uniref:glycosyltransferase n=1 Tax=Acinetobacter indicus TaxID=756892 RepID=UPI00144393EA|nr:glycosyltransferase [Acinetobacter indicus]
MSNIAIVVITYNRLNSLKRLIHSLLQADYDDQIDLIVSIDRSDIFDQMHDYASKILWKHGDIEIKVAEQRLGLKKHVMQCGELLNQYEHIIVLEDDLYVSSGFYQYTKEMISKYGDNENIAGISLYNYPRNQYANLPFTPQLDQYDIYFMKIASSWGQVWSRQKWAKFLEWYNLNPSIDELHIPKHIKQWGDKSWLKYHHAYCAAENKYFVYPRMALSTNFSEPGEHASLDSTYQTELLNDIKANYRVPDSIENAIRYDEFFENENIKKNINIPDLTIDLYGKKYIYERYVLTTKHLNKKIIKSYALRMKPWEVNVTHNIEGADFFLYDFNVEERNFFKSRESYKYKYLFKINSPREILNILLSYFFKKISGLKRC